MLQSLPPQRGRVWQLPRSQRRVDGRLIERVWRRRRGPNRVIARDKRRVVAVRVGGCLAAKGEVAAAADAEDEVVVVRLGWVWVFVTAKPGRRVIAHVGVR